MSLNNRKLHNKKPWKQVNLTWAHDAIKIQHLVSGQLKKKCDLNELSTWASNMVTWYWSTDSMFWLILIDHNMDVHFKDACLCQPINWSTAAILCDSATFVCTHKQYR